MGILQITAQNLAYAFMHCCVCASQKCVDFMPFGYHQARGYNVYGIEADVNIRRVAEKYSYKMHVDLFDYNLYKSDYFSYITSDHVIKHITDPAKVLSGIARIIKQEERSF